MACIGAGRCGLAVVAVAAWLCVCGSFAVASADSAVTLRSADLDGDGIGELILENAFLSVEVFTGESAPMGSPSWLSRLLRRESGAEASRYGTRFVGPGWIRNVVYRPSGRRWFVNKRFRSEFWDGIPEEFEVAVRMREIEPNVYEALKIGVGVCRGTGLCLRGSLRLVDPGEWTSAVRETPTGGRELSFTHTVSTPYGYGYVYTKTLGLEPGEAHLRVVRSLRNTGSEPLRTTCYTHEFWGQGHAGNGYDQSCWSSMPIASRLASGEGPIPLDTEPCHLIVGPGSSYWGSLSAEMLGGSWNVSGNSVTEDVFASLFPRGRLAWYRMWTHPETYSCEPFMRIDLAPGEEDTWTVSRICGVGLQRVRDVQAAGMCDWRWEPGGASPRLRVLFLPREPLVSCAAEAVFQVRNAAGVSAPVSLTAEVVGGVATASPSRPLTAVFPLPSSVGAPVSMELTLRGRRVGGDTVSLRVTAALDPGEPLPGASDVTAGGASAIVFAPLGKPVAGAAPQPDRAGAFLRTYLAHAGFSVVCVDPRSGGAVPGVDTARLLVFAGAERMSAPLLQQLERAVHQGAGLLLTGAISARAFEFSDLLPLESVAAEVRVTAGAPRDGTEEFRDCFTQRYHLAADGTHPIIRGLPLYPAAYQNIASLQVVVPRQGAEVVLRYATPPGLEPQIASPALVVDAVGGGRVAVLSSPVDWGSPPAWVTWSRLGESHRRLLTQTALWVSGLLPD